MAAGNTAIVAIIAILVLVLLVFFLFFGGFNVFQRDMNIDVDLDTPAEPAAPPNPGGQNGEDAPQNYLRLPFSVDPQVSI